MGFFDFDIAKEGVELLPNKQRKPRFKAFVEVFLLGIRSLYQSFRIDREKNIFKVAHGQHVAHLEAVLNDAFDLAFRRIRVVNAAVQYEPVYVYRDLEEKPVPIFMDSEASPKPIFTEYEVDELGLDFIIQIHYTIPYDLARMQALVNEYKTPGMAYVIEEII